MSALMLAIAASSTAATTATIPARLFSASHASVSAKTEDADENHYETLLYEDFSKWSAGTPDEPDGNMYPLN